jgi:hypothetical protein
MRARCSTPPPQLQQERGQRVRRSLEFTPNGCAKRLLAVRIQTLPTQLQTRGIAFLHRCHKVQRGGGVASGRSTRGASTAHEQTQDRANERCATGVSVALPAYSFTVCTQQGRES